LLICIVKHNTHYCTQYVLVHTSKPDSHSTYYQASARPLTLDPNSTPQQTSSLFLYNYCTV